MILNRSFSGDMAGKQHRVLLIGDELLQKFQHVVPDHRVQTADGFVQEEKPGAVGHGHGNGELHFHAPGKFLDFPLHGKLQGAAEPLEFLCQLHEQAGVHLVVEETVHLEYAAGQDFAVRHYAALEKLQKPSPPIHVRITGNRKMLTLC